MLSRFLLIIIALASATALTVPATNAEINGQELAAENDGRRLTSYHYSGGYGSGSTYGQRNQNGFIGFLAGIATFLSLGAFCEKEDEEDAEEPSRMQAMSTSLLEAGAPKSDAHAHPTTPTPRPRLGEAAQLKSASKLGHVYADLGAQTLD